jgi:HSP20 family molecular chaperone IbpA
MFNKQRCKRCKEKIDEKHVFCPYCGVPTGKGMSEEDWGLLGKDDEMQEMENFGRGLFAGMNDKLLNKMLTGAMKMLEKEMQKGTQEQQKGNLNTNFELYVNGKRINPENIKVMKRPSQERVQRKSDQHINQFNQDNLKKFSSLPKKEPSTNVRRLSNKVIYEIDVPGVESIEDVSIAKLESSIEIKAVTNDTAYKKIINVDLPLKQYKLDKDKLILELGVKN